MTKPKFDLIRKMAAGEVFTSLGPAERNALRTVLDAYDASNAEANKLLKLLIEMTKERDALLK